MISSWFEDIYSKEDITIDVFKLCNTLGVKFILGEITKATPITNKVFLSNVTQLEYKIVSYDLGSLSLTDTYSDLIKNSYTIKPFNNASEIKKIFKEKPYGNYCIIGAGVSSIEISGAIAASIGNGAKLDLITKDLGLMPYSQLNLKHSIEKNLKKYPCISIKKYKARKWQLAIYNMGNHIAIFHYGPFVFSGKTAWHIKKWIDTRYIKQYKQLYENK